MLISKLYENCRIYGPYLRKDNRKHVVIYNLVTKKRTTVSYPKFLLQEKIGRVLTGEETTDHKDEDFTNDCIENLQILTRVENAKKSIVPAKIISLVCKWCNTEFQRRKAVEDYNREFLLKEGPFCSRTCQGTYFSSR